MANKDFFNAKDHHILPIKEKSILVINDQYKDRVVISLYKDYEDSFPVLTYIIDLKELKELAREGNTKSSRLASLELEDVQ